MFITSSNLTCKENQSLVKKTVMKIKVCNRINNLKIHRQIKVQSLIKAQNSLWLSSMLSSEADFLKIFKHYQFCIQYIMEKIGSKYQDKTQELVRCHIPHKAV